MNKLLEQSELQLQVFGAERMAQLPDYQASPATTERFISKVGAVAAGGVHGDYLNVIMRKLSTGKGNKFMIARVNPDCVLPSQEKIQDLEYRAIAGVYDLTNEHCRLWLPRRNLRRGECQITESLLVDVGREAKVLRKIKHLPASYRVRPGRNLIEAVKPATEPEVIEAINKLLGAIPLFEREKIEDELI
jgi:hypothetical protein